MNTIASPLSPGGVWLVVGLVSLVQFYVGLESSMLLPMGPLLADQLRFPVEHLGYLNGAFLIAASIAGLIGSLCLDRFDRRRALSVALTGLAIGTAAAAFSTNLETLLICRVLAGICGGPTVSLGLAIVGDATPAALRGRAMGSVSAGSSIALILGIPIALQIADWTSFRGTFLVVGAIGIVLAIAAAIFLPSGLGRRSAGFGVAEALRDFAKMLKRRDTRLALLNGALVLSSIQILAANLAAFFVENLGESEHELKYLWAAGGAAGLFGAQLCGRLADCFGVARVFWGVSGLAASLYFIMFVRGGAGLPAILMMCIFLICATGRIVLSNTINSMTPAPEQRGRFMSLMSASNQASSAIAMICAGNILKTGPSGALMHFDIIGSYAILATLLSPLVASILAGAIKRDV